MAGGWFGERGRFGGPPSWLLPGKFILGTAVSKFQSVILTSEWQISVKEAEATQGKVTEEWYDSLKKNILFQRIWNYKFKLNTILIREKKARKEARKEEEKKLIQNGWGR
jgi:hypothetical protein